MTRHGSQVRSGGGAELQHSLDNGFDLTGALGGGSGETAAHLGAERRAQAPEASSALTNAGTPLYMEELRTMSGPLDDGFVDGGGCWAPVLLERDSRFGSSRRAPGIEDKADGQGRGGKAGVGESGGGAGSKLSEDSMGK